MCCCTIGQMARQTGDYPNYGSSCCSFTGLNTEDKTDRKIISFTGSYIDSHSYISSGGANMPQNSISGEEPDIPCSSEEPDIPCGNDMNYPFVYKSIPRGDEV
mmetsp:Transcript_14328/g.31368  ORF Transcript_14328/g.31368 Transcript_14328/m.31368 type:complete len:103 (+) Transcript_14328:148-456(+)